MSKGDIKLKILPQKGKKMKKWALLLIFILLYIALLLSPIYLKFTILKFEIFYCIFWKRKYSTFGNAPLYNTDFTVQQCTIKCTVLHKLSVRR